VFLYYTADYVGIYVFGWIAKKLNNIELRRLNRFGCKRAHKALLFNKPISDHTSVE